MRTVLTYRRCCRGLSFFCSSSRFKASLPILTFQLDSMTVLCFPQTYDNHKIHRDVALLYFGAASTTTGLSISMQASEFPSSRGMDGVREPMIFRSSSLLTNFCSPPQDQRQKGLAPPRGRLDDPTNQGEQSQKRPSLLDTHHLSKRSSTGQMINTPPCLFFG